MGCAMLLPLGNTEDEVCVAELGAFCVDPAFRYGDEGSQQGYSSTPGSQGENSSINYVPDLCLPMPTMACSAAGSLLRGPVRL